MNQMQAQAMDRVGELAGPIFRTPCSVGSGDGESLVEKVADALWMVLRECEDKCDLELTDVSNSHVVWQLANVAIGAIATQGERA